MVVQLGLSLVFLATDMALGYPVNDLSDVFTMGILALFVMSLQFPRQVELLMALLALVVPGRFICNPLAKDASDSI